MSFRMRGRRVNEAMVDEMHRHLLNTPGLSARGIARRIAGEGRRPPPISSVQYWLGILVRRKFIDENRLPLRDSIWPAYLLLDLPDERQLQVDRILASLRPRPTRDTVSGTSFNTIVRLGGVALPQLEQLRQRCLQAGARDARSLIVLSAA
jgi:hypothetical protein